MVGGATRLRGGKRRWYKGSGRWDKEKEFSLISERR